MTALLSALLDLGIAAILFAAGWAARGVAMEREADAETDRVMGTREHDRRWEQEFGAHVDQALALTVPEQRRAAE